MVRIRGEGEGEGPAAAMAVAWAAGWRPWLVVMNGPATRHGSRRENRERRLDRESEERESEAEARELLKKGVLVLDL